VATANVDMNFAISRHGRRRWAWSVGFDVSVN
jgi:hypothetical protein